MTKTQWELAFDDWPGWRGNDPIRQAFKAGWDAVLASHAPREPEALARRFHDSYERLAPQFGYETRKESAKPWSEVPDKNKQLMIAVCRELLSIASSDPKEEVVAGHKRRCAIFGTTVKCTCGASEAAAQPTPIARYCHHCDNWREGAHPHGDIEHNDH